EVKVLDIDVDKRRISLGIKQLTDDPWEDLARQFSVGTETECEIVRILDRGMVVSLTSAVEGFIPLNQLGQDVSHPSEIYQVGDKTPAEVSEFDLESRKIILSITDYFKEKDEALWKEYLEKYVIHHQGKDAIEKSGEKSEEAVAPEKEEAAE
ncbi:MAG TPA: 30S ribosomal protein S1, partial [Fibrobacteres bacterium]|nr:30S ribosomal protein S1 [Fibrobacterota bacterium]